MKSEPRPDSEELVAEAFKRHPTVVRYVHAGHNSQLDRDGTDFLVDFKEDEYFFPLSIRLQVKTSNNFQTLSLVLPLGSYLPDTVRNKLNQHMYAIIQEHQRKHPHVNCLLFVSRPNSDQNITKEKILDDIWKEMERMLHFIERHFIKPVENRKRPLK